MFFGTRRVVLRTALRDSDVEAVVEMIRSTGFFREDEIKIAAELVEERLARGPASGYEFIIADLDDRSIAYSCYGLIPCTIKSYDLYWIVTDQEFRNRGIGRWLLKETEQAIRALGGRGIYADTSSLPQYESTRQFYLRNQYVEAARFPDFYQDGDDKLVYFKMVRPEDVTGL
jgi:ribosomal protein S18 acetylase RimI-like enzyme